MKNAISWFEIPTTDINRAQKFYETLFNIKMTMEGIGGTLVQISDDFYKPSATDGPLIYLDGNPDLQIVLNRVEEAGGKILVPKTTISDDYGDMAVFLDTEGNRIALHNIPAKYQNA